MPRRVAVALLAPPVWSPPGVDPAAWRLALAEDVLDVFAAMVEVDAAVAVLETDADLLRQIGWPGLRGYVVSCLDVVTVFAAVAGDGYDQAVLLAADAPDLPGMLIAKLLRPLTSRPVAAAPAIGAANPLDEAHRQAVAREEAQAERGGTGGGAAPDPTGPAPVTVIAMVVPTAVVPGPAGTNAAATSAAGTGAAGRNAAGTAGNGAAGTAGTGAGEGTGAAGTGAAGTSAEGAGAAGTGAAGTGAAGTGVGSTGLGGLFGLSATLPAAGWLPAVGLDDLTPQSLRRLAPVITDVAPAPGWHRMRTPADLARLDPRLEGWDATRALLTPRR